MKPPQRLKIQQMEDKTNIIESLNDSIRAGHEIALKDAAAFEASTPCAELLRLITEQVQAQGLNLENTLHERGSSKPTRSDRVGLFITTLLQMSEAAGRPFSMLNGRPCYYNGKYWETLARIDQGYFFTRAAMVMGLGAFDAIYCKFVSEAIQTFETATRAKILKPAKACNLLNFQNGTLEVRPEGSTFREHRAEDGFLYVLPYDYDPEATAPKFEKFLGEVLERAEDRANIQEYCGALFSDIRHDKFAYLYGATGNNGKTTFKDIICAALGSANVSAVSLDTLTENTNNGSAARALLEGKLLNACGEIESKIKSSALLKALASREEIEVRKLYENPRKISQYARMLFCCNDLPQFTQGAATAEARRFLFIEFDREIAREKINRNLTREIVADELPGVLNWMLRGLKRFADEGGNFTGNPNSELIRLQFLEGNNSVFAYLKEYNIIPTTDTNIRRYPRARREKITLRDWYENGFINEPNPEARESYCTFCRNNNRRPMGRNKFKAELERVGFVEQRESRARYFEFIQLSFEELAEIEANGKRLF